MADSIWRAGWLVVFVALVLAACTSAKPFDYQPVADEMKPGSGLFSGDDGEWIVYQQ